LRGEGREIERERTGYEPFALHAPIQWAIEGYVTAEEGVIECPCRQYDAFLAPYANLQVTNNYST